MWTRTHKHTHTASLSISHVHSHQQEQHVVATIFAAQQVGKRRVRRPAATLILDADAAIVARIRFLEWRPILPRLGCGMCDLIQGLLSCQVRDARGAEGERRRRGAHGAG